MPSQNLAPGETSSASGERSLSSVIGGSAVLGAALLLPSEAQSQELPQPPAVVQRVDIERQAVVEITSPHHVLQRFNKNVHVYASKNAQGNFPIPEGQLKEIAQKLSGTDYYLVVIAESAPFRYTTPNGNAFSGKQAVQMLLGQELFSQENFAAIRSRGGAAPEKSASLFVITMDPPPNRGWFFSSSPFHERSGLVDENEWNKGANYVQIAGDDFRARRFADGVAKTVDRIEADLHAKIDTAMERATQLRSGAEIAANGARDRFTEYQKNLAELNTRFPNRSGELFHPRDIAELGERVAEAQRALDLKNYASATQIGNALGEQLATRLKNIVDYPVAEATLVQLDREVARLRKDEFSFTAAPQLKEATALITEAHNHWERGDILFASSIDAAASSLRGLRSSLDDALRVYHVDGEKITELVERSEQLQRSPHASAAANELSSATEKVGRVQRLWEMKDPSYPEILRDAADGVNQAAEKISISADRAASLARFWNTVFGAFGIIAAGAAVAGGVVNLGVRKRGVEAHDAFKRLQSGMRQKEEALEALEHLKDRALKAGGKPLQFAADTETAKCALVAREAIEKLWLFQLVAHEEVLSQAGALLKRGGIFRSDNYNQAVKVLTVAPVVFSDKNRDRIKRAFNESTRGVEALTVPIEELAVFSKSMREIDEESIVLSRSATESLNKIAHGREQAQPLVNGCREIIGEIQTISTSLAESARTDTTNPNLFNFPMIEAALLPFAEKQLLLGESLVESDPVRSAEVSSDLARGLTPVRDLLQLIKDERTEKLANLRTTATLLRESGLSVDWVDRELQRASRQATDAIDETFSVLKGERAEEETSQNEVSKTLAALFNRVQRTVEFNVHRVDTAAAEISRLDQEVSSARKVMGRELGVSPEKILTEKGANPDKALSEARGDYAALTEAISGAEFEEAQRLLTEISGLVSTGRDYVTKTQTIFDGRSQAKANIATEQTNLEESIAPHRQSLKEISATYAKKALRFVDEDELQDEADKTVENNIDEMEEALQLSRTALDSAQELFGKGKILQAAVELERAHECCRFGENRGLEIIAKGNALRTLSEANEADISRLEKRMDDIEKVVGQDQIVSAATVEFFEGEVTAAYDRLLDIHENTPCNPYEVQTAVAEVEDYFNSVEQAVEADKQLHGELLAELATVAASIEKATKLSAKIEGDRIPDSEEIDRAQQKIEQLTGEFAQRQSEITGATRGDWGALLEEVTRISAAIALAVKSIKSEDKVAHEALEVIEAAGKNATAAARWSGGHGITITGQPGNAELRKSREFLAQADYVQALQWGERSIERSDGAIKEAQAKVNKIESRLAREKAERVQRELEKQREWDKIHTPSSRTYGGGSSSDVDAGQVLGAVVDILSHSNSIFGSSGGSSSSNSSGGGIGEVIGGIADAVSDSSGGSDGTW